LDGHEVGETGPVGELARRVDEVRADVDAGDVAAVPPRGEARRTPEPAADVQEDDPRGEPEQVEQRRGGRGAPRVELVVRRERVDVHRARTSARGGEDPRREVSSGV